MTEQAQNQHLPTAPVYREPDRHVARVTVYDPPALGYSPADLTELGAMLASTGMSKVQVRSLMAKIQQAAMQTATAIAPELLEEIRRIQEWRLHIIRAQIRNLPMYMGHVQRDRVLQIIDTVATQVPQP